MFRTGNPILNQNTFAKSTAVVHETGHMTVDGVVNKTTYFFLLALLPAAYTWYLFLNGNPLAITLMYVGIFGGLITALITAFKKEWAHITGTIYAVFAGFMIGGFSSFFESMFPGIVIQAVALTFGVMAGMLFLYKTKVIKVNDKFRTGVVAATIAVFAIYMVSFVMSFFGTTIPLIHESGLIGIGFSLLVVGIAALNLVLDFDFIEKGAESHAPKHLEWYAAFGLMVTLVWLYIEILRLLSKLRSRN